MLLVSAELNEVLALSDRVAVMYRGKFVDRHARAPKRAKKRSDEYMIGTRNGVSAA